MKDPVCEMTVDPDNPRGGSAVSEGRTYFFCSSPCREKFTIHPETYLKNDVFPAGDVKRAMLGRNEYTCPMHPEIVRSRPGPCPICGMALEPITVSASEPENSELRNMTRRFWIGLGFSLPLLALAMGETFFGDTRWIQFVLATPV